MKTIINKSKIFILILITLIISSYHTTNVFSQDAPSQIYIPLIGITLVPEPLALPEGENDVTYHYAVKNFLRDTPLTDVIVIDDTCSMIEFTEGDDNEDSKLDYSETWRYICNKKIFTTTESSATATGTANNITTTHKAYATVVVGSNNPAPLVNIINITKVAYPLSLPSEGGDITFTYRVNNPGIVPLSNVSAVDDKCSTMSSKLGDTNGNNLLDTKEVWVYTCTTHLTETTANTVSVAGYANGLKAISYATITVTVDTSVPIFPETGEGSSSKITIWVILGAILIILIIVFKKMNKNE